MGKRVKPKGRNPQKQPRSRGSDTDPNRDQSDRKPNTSNEEETTKTREGCSHYTKGDSHLNKILLSILSSNSEFSSCDHCCDNLPQANRKGGAGGGKKKKKKGGGAGPRGGEAKPNTNSIWVCLDCGRSFCGDEVDKVPYGHARRHAKQERHSWAVGPTSSGTAWCFFCDAEVPIEMPAIEESIINTSKPTSEPDYTKAMKTDAKQEAVPLHAGPHHHSIRGLSNLGNTCFFNSVLQNLLALKILRESILSPGNSDPGKNGTLVTGPLTMSLRKLFLETNGGDDCKGVLSPKNLFGNICSKAPQFRGYQQQDSHELLRYLLDGLNMEETSAQKLKQADYDKGGSDTASTTLVDSMFSGRLSSTISCLECGNTSVVHEPFLDLSLPVPAKKMSTVAKRGGNRPSLVRGRGRSQRSRDRPASRTSPVDEEKTRKQEDAIISSKTAGGTEGTLSEAGEMSDPKSACTGAGADIPEEVAVSKEEVDGSGSGAGPESTAAGIADYSWMDFLVDEDTAAVAQEPSEAEPALPEVLDSDRTASELQSESAVTTAGEAGLKQCTAGEAEPEVSVAVAKTFCRLGNDDLEGKMSLESSPQESESVKQEVLVSESTVVGQGAEGSQSTSSEADISSSAMDIGMKNNAVGFDSAKEPTGGSSLAIGHANMHDAGPSFSVEFTDSTNGSVAKVDYETVGHVSLPCVISDKQEGAFSAKISDKPDSGLLGVKVECDADLLQDQWDNPKRVIYEVKVDDANTLSSMVKSDEQLMLKGNIVKVNGDNGWSPGEYEEVNNMGLKANIDDDIDWLHDQDDKLNGMVRKADVHDDMDWLMDESSEIHSTVVEMRVHSSSHAESYELESTVIVLDGYVPGSVASTETSLLCMDIASSGSKPSSPNKRLISTDSESQDPYGDSIIDSSGLLSSTPTKEESADSCSIMLENTKTDTNTNTGTAIALHPAEDEIKTDPSTVGTEVQQEVEFDGFGDMFNEPEETIGPVNRPDPKPENEDGADSIFWGSGAAFSEFGFNNEEVDDTDKPVSVVSCLELFTKPELLTGEHAWHCEKCSELQSKANGHDYGKGGKKEKVMRDAMKRYMVDRAPQVLTVHLKRFNQDARGRLSKLRGHVNFEEMLDLTPFVHPRSDDKNKCTYQLVGLVEHSGSMSGGHYIAYIRGEKTLKGGVHGQTWFYASDAHVKEVTLSEVLRSEAYLLFYERVKDENRS